MEGSKTMTNSKSFGELILTARKRKFLSQQQAADKLNVTQQSISLYEKGEAEPSFSKAREMLSILRG